MPRQANVEVQDNGASLERVVQEIEKLLKSVIEKRSFGVRFYNPDLVKCWEVEQCHNSQCPAYKSEMRRCWHMVGTLCKGTREGKFVQKIGSCRKCKVYKQTTSNKLYAIGETFNDMMEILENSNRQLKDYAQNLESMVRERTVELERANQELRKLDGLKSEFITTTSHELRTPLTSVRSCAEMLYDKLGHMPQEAQSRFLQIIVNETDRLTHLVNGLLDLQTIEFEGQVTRMETLDMAAIIERAVTTHRLAAADKGIELSTNIPNKLPQIVGNKYQLMEVMDNLISNAIKFTPPGGNIIVGATVKRGRLGISVIDSGIGLSVEQQGKVFDKFYRAKHKLTEETPGTGLGLAIVKRIIEKHGGSIEVASTPDKGSTFSFTLPMGVDKLSVSSKRNKTRGRKKSRDFPSH